MSQSKEINWKTWLVLAGTVLLAAYLVKKFKDPSTELYDPLGEAVDDVSESFKTSGKKAKEGIKNFSDSWNKPRSTDLLPVEDQKQQSNESLNFKDPEHSVSR